MSEKNCNLCFIRQFAPPPRKGKSVYDEPPYDNGVTKPPMGWSSWNCFRNNIDEEKIEAIADALIKTGLADVGYTFVNLDDNWHSSMRDGDGNLQGDLGRFPHGIPALIKKINDKGLKVGLYSSNGTLTCEDLPAGFGNEERDAYTIAKWGAEFFKYDFCHHHAYSNKAPYVAAIELIKTDDPDVKITINAADAVLGGKAMVVQNEKMPGGSYVKGLDKNEGILVFDSVKTEKEGEYALTIITKKHGEYEKFLAVETNGEYPALLTVPSCKKFNFTARVQTVVTLKKGDNNIKLYNPIVRTTDGYVYQYRNMGKMLKKATERVSIETQKPEKPITYSICEWGWNRPWRWGASAGNQWRTTPDIRPWWWWMNLIYERTVRLYEYAGKGHYNDPDMLEVGNGKLTYEENKSHFTLWCMMNSPLILGNDLRKFIKEDGTVDEENPVLKILKNEKMIAVNQDGKGKQCKRVKTGSVDILIKPVTEGVAVCFFNRCGGRKTVKADVTKYCGDEYLEFTKKESYAAEDLWTGEKFDTAGQLAPTLPPHGVAVYLLK